MVSESSGLSLVWLEITGKCQLACEHCYAESGPKGTHGTMSLIDWERVIDQASELDVSTVQFIGGEPTLHAGLPALVQHALDRGIHVEVFSNLARVTDNLWEVFGQPGVRLATSYYSPDAREHDAITGRRSHDKTLAGIREAVRRKIPLRVGVIAVRNGQQAFAAKAELTQIGVTEVRIDVLRQVGRGARGRRPDVGELCGHCSYGSLAVSPTGEVWPCTLARWLSVGNVRKDSLAAVHAQAADVRRELAVAFAGRRSDRCSPDSDGGPPLCDPWATCGPLKSPPPPPPPPPCRPR